MVPLRLHTCWLCPRPLRTPVCTRGSDPTIELDFVYMMSEACLFVHGGAHLGCAGSESTLCPQLLVFVLVALVAGIFTYELAAVQPNWCVQSECFGSVMATKCERRRSLNLHRIVLSSS